ncbi:MAG TPA: hypothetical protein VI299_17705 [Polyangiales bacterium]
MLKPFGGAPFLGAVFALAFTGHARADQFIVADETYTHSAQTTSDSHYRVAPKAGTPADWTKPTDYAKGSAHVLLEVKTKPSDTPTKFQICFEGTPTYACTDQSPTYTKPGKYEWTTPFARFYQGDGMQMNWANGVTKVALILKDDKNNKPQGDPKFVPTDLHVEVAIVSADDSYHPPAASTDAGTQDAGTGDAGAKDGGAMDAGTKDAGASSDGSTGAAPRDASVATRDAGMRPTTDAAARDAGTEVTVEENPASAGEGGSSGCALGTRGGASWLLSALLALGLRRRRATNRPR